MLLIQAAAAAAVAAADFWWPLANGIEELSPIFKFYFLSPHLFVFRGNA